jgi:NhaP-type Na+/H+ or K+/H+ antiporter
VLIGLQVGPILQGLAPAELATYLQVAAAVLATVIVVRIAWVMSYHTLVQLKVRWYGFAPPRPMLPPSVGGGILVSWCGMRGVVTLAAALALPNGEGDAAFPYRDLIVLTAFSVVLGTLVLQGLTLRPLLARLNVQDDDPVGREVALARDAAYRAVLGAIDGDESPEAKSLRREYAALLQAANVDDGGSVAGSPIDALRRRGIAAARDAVSDLRTKGEIGDDAFHRLEEELDWAELSAMPRGNA